LINRSRSDSATTGLGKGKGDRADEPTKEPTTVPSAAGNGEAVLET
jgi:hypothetical protein